jgi:peptidoglycan-associated lipoprotein
MRAYNVKMASLAMAILFLTGLAACKTTKVDPTPPAVTEPTPTTSTAPAVTPPMGAGQQLTSEQLAKQAAERAGMVIYFDYDSSEIKSEYAAVVAVHAKYLASNSSLKARLEGNTDERGSREYNIGLGERRAQAVRRALLLQGVAEAQITTLSYGEEHPAVSGSDEAAYAKNRRVEFGY